MAVISCHAPGGVNPMSGPNLTDITSGSGLFATYDDVTGALNASLLITQGGS
ncbi:MAG: hypothetical protein RQ982_09470 [Gammaproteobacteria bacterium]|nr:hypothetical protein [Gammaproteobacteria bacterium]